MEDIRNTPAPTNKTCLQQFLGIATYMSPFVPQLAELTAPLRDLMKQDVDFQWNASHQEAFAIAKQTTLVHFDRNLVDASSRGLGAVRLQDNNPVAFARKSLTEYRKLREHRKRDAGCGVWLSEILHLHIWQ